MSRSRQFKWVKKGIGQLEFKIESSRKRAYERNIKEARPCRGLLALNELTKHYYKAFSYLC